MKSVQQSLNARHMRAQRGAAIAHRLGGYALILVIVLGSLVIAHSAFGLATGLPTVVEQAADMHGT